MTPIYTCILAFFDGSYHKQNFYVESNLCTVVIPEGCRELKYYYNIFDARTKQQIIWVGLVVQHKDRIEFWR